MTKPTPPASSPSSKRKSASSPKSPAGSITSLPTTSPPTPRPPRKPSAIGEAATLLAAAKGALEGLDPWTSDSIKEAVGDVVTGQGVKLGAIMPALRVALSGRLAGPGVFETAEALGRDRTLTRIQNALANLHAQ